MQNKYEYIKSLLPERISRLIPENKEVNEIRIRLGKPLIIQYQCKYTIPDKNTKASPDDIDLIIARMSDYSKGSVNSEIINGFIRLKYGCRAGIAGQAVMKDSSITSIINICSINIRIASERRGCAERLLPDIVNDGEVLPSLIISPPGMGKTTLLRDIARLLGNRMNTAVIDERHEIASMSNGESPFDLGNMTDVIDSMPKSLAITASIRSLSPKVIITDEIGSDNDASALADAFHSGVSFIATAHAKALDDIIKRDSLSVLLNGGIVKKVIVLGKTNGIGTIEDIVTL